MAKLVVINEVKNFITMAAEITFSKVCLRRKIPQSMQFSVVEHTANGFKLVAIAHV